MNKKVVAVFCFIFIACGLGLIGFGAKQIVDSRVSDRPVVYDWSTENPEPSNMESSNTESVQQDGITIMDEDSAAEPAAEEEADEVILGDVGTVSGASDPAEQEVTDTNTGSSEEGVGVVSYVDYENSMQDAEETVEEAGASETGDE